MADAEIQDCLSRSLQQYQDKVGSDFAGHMRQSQRGEMHSGLIEVEQQLNQGWFGFKRFGSRSGPRSQVIWKRLPIRAHDEQVRWKLIQDDPVLWPRSREGKLAAEPDVNLIRVYWDRLNAVANREADRSILPGEVQSSKLIPAARNFNSPKK